MSAPVLPYDECVFQIYPLVGAAVPKHGEKNLAVRLNNSHITVSGVFLNPVAMTTVLDRPIRAQVCVCVCNIFNTKANIMTKTIYIATSKINVLTAKRLKKCIYTNLFIFKTIYNFKTFFAFKL